MADKKTFWITNISKKAINLYDIGITIMPMTSLNLLDSKHYRLTLEQLEKSAKSGSIALKSNYVVVRAVPPDAKKNYLPFDKNAIMPTRHRSAVENEDIKYEELNISDEKYAEENSDTAQQDHLGKWRK